MHGCLKGLQNQREGGLEDFVSNPSLGQSSYKFKQLALSIFQKSHMCSLAWGLCQKQIETRRRPLHSGSTELVTSGKSPWTDFNFNFHWFIWLYGTADIVHWRVPVISLEYGLRPGGEIWHFCHGWRVVQLCHFVFHPTGLSHQSCTLSTPCGLHKDNRIPNA